MKHGNEDIIFPRKYTIRGQMPLGRNHGRNKALHNFTLIKLINDNTK